MRVINEATAARSQRSSIGVSSTVCLDLSEVDELAQALELEDDDVGRLYEQLETRGIDLRDDCGREAEPAPVEAWRSPARPPTRCSCSSTRSAATGC